MLVVFATTVWGLCLIFDKEAGRVPWYMLGTAVVLVLVLFQGWDRVWAASVHGIDRAAPHIQTGGQVVAQSAKDNVVATAAIIFFLLSLIFFASGKGEVATCLFYVSVLFGVAHYKSVSHFTNNWKEYWLAMSVLGILHTFVFGYGLKTVAAFVISATLAAITVFGGWEKTIELAGKAVRALLDFFGKLLFGVYGKPQACLTWTGVMVLIGIIFPSLAFAAMTLAIGCFIASVMLGTKKIVEKE